MENDSTASPHVWMSQWVVYRHPRDYPEKFVLRRWDITRGHVLIATDEVALADTLELIREAVPPGLYCLKRFAEDDPRIVEVWL